jgi:hypothetical protein
MRMGNWRMKREKEKARKTRGDEASGEVDASINVAAKFEWRLLTLIGPRQILLLSSEFRETGQACICL